MNCLLFKAYELSVLTGTQVMLLVASETGHVYTFATKKLQPMITMDAGKNLIRACLSSNENSSEKVDGGGEIEIENENHEFAQSEELQNNCEGNSNVFLNSHFSCLVFQN